MSLIIDTYLPPSECHLENFYILTPSSPPRLDSSMDISSTVPRTPGSAGMFTGSPLPETPRFHLPIQGKRLTMPTDDDDDNDNDEDDREFEEDVCENHASKAPKRTKAPLTRLTELIVQTLAASNGPMRVSEIFAYIERNDEHYAKQNERGANSLRNSVRYVLGSKKDMFVKTVERSKRGHLWSLKPGLMLQIRAR